MSEQALDIDRIVREIVDRLRAEMTTEPTGTLTLNDRVVTMAILEGKLDGVRRLIVGRCAIVTPSVRDELKDKSIELVRAQTR